MIALDFLILSLLVSTSCFSLANAVSYDIEIGRHGAICYIIRGDTGEEIEVKSRAGYGFRELDAHPWQLPVYADRLGSKDFSRSAEGNAIALSERHYLMHIDTVRRLEALSLDDKFDHPHSELIRSVDAITVPTPNVFEKKYGPRPRKKLHSMKIIIPMDKYVFVSLTETYPCRMKNDGTSDFKIKGPKLERNVSHIGTDCYGYGWSERLDKDKDLLYHSSFSVEIEKDKNGKMSAYSSGRGCDSRRDRATPILCGPDKKLTYLASPNESCNHYAELANVAEMVQEIEKNDRVRYVLHDL